MNQGWWDRAIGYEVYVRSFCDSNGDGIGDLAGITSKLDHLAWLGIDIVWLTPFFVSPQADFGYDVADYLDVEPDYGTLDDFDELVDEAHRLGMKVIGDLVPNHTSDRHPWFRAAVADPTSDHRSYYHWADPAPDGGPPNNWVSHFGGPAWTLDEASGQYYLHLFLPEQPDLNWSNPAVADAFDGILRFWLERGIDGFRIDVAHSLTKAPGLPDNPSLRPIDPAMSPREAFATFDHRYDLDQPETKDIYRRWRAVVEPYDALLLGEVYLRYSPPARVAAYVTGGDGLHRAFHFAPMHTAWDPDAMWATFHEALNVGQGGLSWAVSSHDDSRAPSRFGGGDLGRERALAFSTFMLGLPGLPFLYQGDELALTDVPVPPERLADPVGIRNANPADSRDKVRTPMPWAPGHHAGFSTASDTWLPVGDRSDAETVEGQRGDQRSWVHAFRALIAARRALDPGDGDLEWLTEPGDDVLAFRRGAMVCAMNVGAEATGFALPAGGWVERFGASRSRPTRSEPREGTFELDSPDAVLLEQVATD